MNDDNYDDESEFFPEYGDNPTLLLENPRKRRRGRRRKATRSRRAHRRAPRRSRRRARRSRAVMVRGGWRSVRVNPFSMSGLGSRFMGAGKMVVSELAGDVVARVANKVGAAKMWEQLKLTTDQAAAANRGVAALAGHFFLPQLGLSPANVATFVETNLASAIIGLTYPYRAKAFAEMGLNDYELEGNDDTDLLEEGEEMEDFDMAGEDDTDLLEDVA